MLWELLQKMGCQGSEWLLEGLLWSFSLEGRSVLLKLHNLEWKGEQEARMVYLFANVLSSKDALAWIYFMFCCQPPGFLLAASFWVKERSSKQSRWLQKGFPSKKVLGEPLCWGKWAAAKERLEPWNQKRTMAGLFWNGLFTAFLSNTSAHCREVAMECSIKNSISGVTVPLWGWLELAGVSCLLEDVQKP